MKSIMEKKLQGEISDITRHHLENFYKDNPFPEVIGLHIENIEYGSVTMCLDVRHDLTNFYGIAHGGVAMSLADTAMGATCLSCNTKVVTQALNYNFIRAAVEGTRLIATGRVIHNGLKTMVCETEVKDEEGELYGKATGTFFVIGAFDGK